ncbi:hypothetical protein H2200_005137 [Cladophialophora chaetospira]|uniref:NADH:flavin oxidoreductase/NADH oxidase N-terminal domain-containing protein n=1 Tax=Cladophialophora chaetospira TaxID=386627 RepID=A0AA38XBE1_9EURO|nr:hypothetical protein H2200_005137 [Cladophialophora chaetospira]
MDDWQIKQENKVSATAMPSLHSPITIGDLKLQHRVAMAPMSRFRAQDNGVPSDMMVDYYSQRASVPGTLIITESTCISLAGSGRHINAPAIYTKEHISGWKRVTEAVHEKGSYIFVQLWAVGRAALKETLGIQGIDMISASAVSAGEGHPVPQPMTEEDIEMFIHDYAQAARNAMQAGFDGVEIHAANGYLIDQFIQDTCNKRTDSWGGSIANRSRFCLRVVDAVTHAIPSTKVGIRLSPFSEYQGMGMKETIPQFSHLIKELARFNLAYLHLVDPRIHGLQKPDFAAEVWGKHWDKDSTFLRNGKYDGPEAERLVETVGEDHKVVVAFARHFASTPDLPYRLRRNLPLNTWDVKTFYAAKQAAGYTDLPFHESFPLREDALRLTAAALD